MPQKFRQKAILEGASRLILVRLPSQILGAVQGSDRTSHRSRQSCHPPPCHPLASNTNKPMGGVAEFLGLYR